MEQIAIIGLNTLASMIDSLTRLIELYPWVGQVVQFLPVIPALLQRSVLGVLLSGVLAFTALIVFFGSSQIFGMAIWGAAWGISVAFARARKAKRRLKQLRAQQVSV